MAARKELSGLEVLNSLTLDGNAVWHAGNFTPSSKLDTSGFTAAAVLSLLNAAGNNQLTGGLGVGGGTADATNRLAVNGPASLFNHNGSGGHQVKLNKALAADTASFLFQTGFSGRAEFGTLGNDAFGLKTSANGSAWTLAFEVSTAGVLDFKTIPTLNGTDLRTNIPDNIFALADNADATKRAVFELSGITTAVTRTYTLPNVDGALATLGNIAQTFAASSITFQASALTLGNSTAASTYNLGTGATLNGNTKTINIGENGVSGSTTVVNIGSTVSGALGSLVVNCPTVTFASTVTAIGAANANLSTKWLGVGGATADATNRLSVNTPAVLLNNAGAGIDVTFNKAAAANDASFTFKDNFTTKALLGLLANDDFTIKVGASFTTAMVIAEASGKVTVHQGLNLNPMAADLSTPVDGDIWYNSTLGKFRGRQAGSTVDLIGAGGGGVSDGDKGEVTVSGSGTVWTIDPQTKYGLSLALHQNAYFN